MAQEHELKFVLTSSAQGIEQGMKAAARALETLGEELGELKKELDKSDAALDELDDSQRETAAAADEATAAIKSQSDAQREVIRSTEQVAREQELQTKEIVAGTAAIRNQSDAQREATGSSEQMARAQELQTKEIVAGVAAVGTIIAAYKGLQQAVSVAIDAYVDQRNSLVGLRSIAEGTGNSMASLEADLVKLTKSGLVPMADAATALKNLLSRGYTADQAVAVIERLTDAAAFGRQANLDLGEAVRTASEGIRNENSILVDNAGITKNVAKMWADYADQIGVSVNELTMAQKIQAEYNGIMEESKHQVGDAAKLAEEYSGSQAQLEASLQRVKVAFGEAAAEGVKPYVDIMGDLTSGVADVLEKNRTLTAVLLTGARMFATTGLAVGGTTVAISALTGGAAASIPVIGTLAKAVIGLKTAMGPLPLIIAAVVGIGSAIFAGMSASAKQAEEDMQALREEALMMGDAFVHNSEMVAKYEQLSSKGTRATAQETAELEEVSRRLVETYGDRVGYLDDEGKAIITNVEAAKDQLKIEKDITLEKLQQIENDLILQQHALKRQKVDIDDSFTSSFASDLSLETQNALNQIRNFGSAITDIQIDPIREILDHAINEHTAAVEKIDQAKTDYEAAMERSTIALASQFYGITDQIESVEELLSRIPDDMRNAFIIDEASLGSSADAIENLYHKLALKTSAPMEWKPQLENYLTESLQAELEASESRLEQLQASHDAYEAKKDELSQQELELQRQRTDNLIQQQILQVGELSTALKAAIQNAMSQEDFEEGGDAAGKVGNFIARYFAIEEGMADEILSTTVPEIQAIRESLMAELATTETDTGEASSIIDQILGDFGSEEELAMAYDKAAAIKQKISEGIATPLEMASFDQEQARIKTALENMQQSIETTGKNMKFPTDGITKSLDGLIKDASKTSKDFLAEMAKIRAAEETPLSMAKSISSLSSDLRDLASAADEAQVMQEAIDIISSGAEGTDEYSNALAYLADMYGITEDAVLSQLDSMQADADMKVTLAYLNIQLAITEAQAAVAVVQAMNDMAGGTITNADAMINALNQVIAKAEELAGTHFELEESADGKSATITLKKLNVPSPFSGSGGGGRGGGGGGGGGRRPSGGGGSRGGGGSAGRTSTEAYKNEALDNAYDVLEARKRVNDLTLAEEVKMLEQIKRIHVKTAEEIEEVNAKLYEARREMRKADYDYAVAMDRLTLREQADALRAERDLYKQGTEAWRDYQKQIHNIEKELRQQNYDLAVYYDQLTLEEQVTMLRKMASEYRVGTNARIELEKQAYDIEKQLRQQNYEDDVYFGRITLERQREQLKERMRMYKAGTEAYKELQRQVHDVEQQIRDRDIESINRLNEGIATALRKRYEVQRDAEQKRINDSIKDWQDWATAQQDAIRDQITALDDLAQAEDREEQERKKRRDIAALEQRILYETDDYNRRKLSEELARKEDELNKWLRRNEVQDLKKSLNEQSRVVQERAREEQEALREKLSKNNDYYAELMESASIAAESQKLIADGSQTEILKLMKTYAPEYDLLGKSFGERFVDGFSGQVKDIQTFMDSLSAPIVNYQHQMATVANAAAIKFWTQRGEAAKPEKATNPGAVQTTVPNIELHFHEKVESPVEVRRELERLIDNLSRL